MIRVLAWICTGPTLLCQMDDLVDRPTNSDELSDCSSGDDRIVDSVGMQILGQLIYGCPSLRHISQLRKHIIGERA